jgi:hypothetical protein
MRLFILKGFDSPMFVNSMDKTVSVTFVDIVNKSGMRLM